MKITVSNNALQRCVERLGCSYTEARALLTSPAVRLATRFGARVIRHCSGRIVLTYTPAGATVITVLPIDDSLPSQLIPAGWGGSIPVAYDPNFHPEPREQLDAA